MNESIYRDPDYIAGYRAASRGDPLWEHNTEAWLIGFRDFWKDQAEKAERARECRLH